MGGLGSYGAWQAEQNSQLNEYLGRLKAAAEEIVKHHPAEYIQTEYDDGEYRCFYCGAVEHNTPEAEALALAMQTWLTEHPSPELQQQAIKRKDAPDPSEWDRRNQQIHNSYARKLGHWRRLYREAYDKIWGDPNQHPGTAIDHKEDCLWLKLKEAL